MRGGRSKLSFRRISMKRMVGSGSREKNWKVYQMMFLKVLRREMVIIRGNCGLRSSIRICSLRSSLRWMRIPDRRFSLRMRIR
jgi:hypothetical protein